MPIEDIKVGPIFTPYHLTDFQKCPRLYDLKKRWQPRDEGQKTAMLIGSAVAYGLECHYDGRGRDPVNEAVLYAAGYYAEDSDRSYETVKALVKRGVKHGMATDLGLEEIYGVERWYGRIRPDMVGRRKGTGKLVVIDHKVKMNLDDRYKENELLGFDVSNQMWHYAWAVSDWYGEPVEEVMIHMIVLAPRVYTELHLIRIDQDRLSQWLAIAVQDWRDMHRGENRGRFGACLGKYGPCEFWQGCHTLGVDEEKFPVLYEPRPEYRGREFASSAN